MSYYLPERRALFLHVPRTGGTWIKEAMFRARIPMDKWKKVCPRYRPYKHTILPHYFQDRLSQVDYIFTCVRHPFDYYVSIWRFTTRCVINRPEEMRHRVLDVNDLAAISEAEIRWKPNFDEWLDEMLEEEPGWVTRWFERYVGPDRGEFCHYIGRTETLEQDFLAVMKILGYEDQARSKWDEIENIRHARNFVLPSKVPMIYLSEQQRQQIERVERVTIRRFFGPETGSKRVYRSMSGEPVH